MEVSKPVAGVIIAIVVVVIAVIGYTMFLKPSSGHMSQRTADMYRRMGKLGPQNYAPGGGAAGSASSGPAAPAGQ